MAEKEGNSSGLSALSIPSFNGEHYDRWQLRMQTLFKIHDLWEIVEGKIIVSGDENKKKELKKKELKALYLIQQAVDGPIMDKISCATTAHDAWETICLEYQGSSKVFSVRKQVLMHSFEVLHMEENENIKLYLSRVSSLVNQIKATGHTLTDEDIVRKVLRSLSARWMSVAVAIQESKDLSKLTLEDLSGSLLVYEMQFVGLTGKSEDQVLYAKGESSGLRDSDRRNYTSHQGSFRPPSRCCSPGRSFSRGRGRGRASGRGNVQSGRDSEYHRSGNDRSSEQYQPVNQGGRGSRSTIQCYNCKKFGHVKAHCWQREKQVDKGAASAAVEKKEPTNMFMACAGTEHSKNNLVLVGR